MEVGYLEDPGASTFGGQPVDWTTPPWLVQRHNPAMGFHKKGNKTLVPLTSHYNKKIPMKKEQQGGEGLRGTRIWLKDTSWQENAGHEGN